MLAKLVEAVNKRIDEVRSKLSKETYVLLISGISSIILGVEGYLSVLSGLLCLSSSFLQYMSSDADSFATQFVLSLYFSEACGALMSAPLSDNFGRRSTIAYSSVACILSLLWTMLSRNAADLLTSRTMCGFALGIITSTVPVYIAELALPADRGLLLGTLPVASATGSLLACVSCLLVADVAVWWREFLVRTYVCASLSVFIYFPPYDCLRLSSGAPPAGAAGPTGRPAGGGTREPPLASSEEDPCRGIVVNVYTCDAIFTTVILSIPTFTN